MEKLLLKVRLSSFFWIFFILFMGLSLVVHRTKYESSALTLFSVNSLLYGFYIAPILAAQKARIEELHKTVRAEANALFAIALTTKLFPDHDHDHLMRIIYAYATSVYKTKKVTSGEAEYEELIRFALDKKKQNLVAADKLIDQLIANQTNRSNLAMHLSNKVFSNEWWIMLILFSISISFVITIDIGKSAFLNVVKALLCTGLSMLLVILIKLSTLTHKKAKIMWEPLKKLIDSKFFRID